VRRLLAISLLVLAGACAPARPRQGERPNIVVLVADDMDYEHFGALGYPLSRTPTLDALADAGVFFSHGCVPMSRCRPAQAALLSGLWPHQNGVYFNVGADHIDPETALPARLARAGYGTVGEGKFWEGEARVMGFSNYTIRNYETFVRWDQQHLFGWLDEHAREAPFFVWWAPELPHVPHDPPERLLASIPPESIPVPEGFTGDVAEFRRRERVSLAMEAWLDEGVKDLRGKLAQLGVLEDTLFVFFVDNGWANGCVSKGWGHDKGLRSPMILSWPKGFVGGARHADLVSPVDLHATILDYAGLAPLPGCQGQSMRARLEGRPSAPRAALYGALYPLQSREARTDPARDAYGLWARTERWKFILSLRDLAAQADAGSDEGEREDIKVSLAPDFARRRGELELYDLANDPRERVNLADAPEHAELLARLRSETLSWWRATGGGALDLP
jgi:uncharacterized sulfatase